METKLKKSIGSILIVENEQATCELLKTYCSNMGCFTNIITAEDGSLAAIKLRNQKFSVLIIDLKINKKNALPIIQEMRASTHNQNCLIMVKSKEIDADTLNKLIALNIKCILPYPFDENLFQQKMISLLKTT